MCSCSCLLACLNQTVVDGGRSDGENFPLIISRESQFKRFWFNIKNMSKDVQADVLGRISKNWWQAINLAVGFIGNHSHHKSIVWFLMIPDQSKYQLNFCEKQKADDFLPKGEAGLHLRAIPWIVPLLLSMLWMLTWTDADVWNKQARTFWSRPVPLKTAMHQRASTHQDTSVKRVCFLRDSTEDACQPWLHVYWNWNAPTSPPLVLGCWWRMNHTAGLHLLVEWRWTVTCTHAAATCTAVQIQKSFQIKSLSFLVSLSFL